MTGLREEQPPAVLRAHRHDAQRPARHAMHRGAAQVDGVLAQLAIDHDVGVLEADILDRQQMAPQRAQNLLTTVAAEIQSQLFEREMHDVVVVELLGRESGAHLEPEAVQQVDSVGVPELTLTPTATTT